VIAAILAMTGLNDPLKYPCPVYLGIDEHLESNFSEIMVKKRHPDTLGMSVRANYKKIRRIIQ